MGQKSQTRQTGSDRTIKDIRRATRKQYSAEEKIHIVSTGKEERPSVENHDHLSKNNSSREVILGGKCSL